MRSSLHPDSIRRILLAYAKVQPNLARHEAGFPTADRLRALIREGQPGYGMAAVGAGRDTPGSRLIVEALERGDPRPLWISVWGGVTRSPRRSHDPRDAIA